MKNFTAIDLFAGIGGIKLGLKNAGFDVIYSNDNDKYCKITFDNYFREKLDNRDITTIPSEEIPDHDLLAAGFPCQPFSKAGYGRGFYDPRGSLYLEIVRILKDKRPKAFLLENVKHLRGHNNKETFNQILSSLQDLGYYVTYNILNSKDFGLPQNRQRIYFVGFKDKIEFKFPEPLTHLNPKISDILENEVDDESYFLSQKYYEGLVKHKKRHRAKKSGFGFEILDLNGIANSLVVGNMGRERNLIQDSPRPGFYKKGMDKSIAKNSLGVRKLTIRECARLQGFPENFKFPVSRTQAYKQLGNTVSISVIKQIAQIIKKSINRGIKHIDNSTNINNEAVPLKVPSIL